MTNHLPTADLAALSVPAPKASRKTFHRVCHECGAAFDTTHPGKEFCTDAHKKAFHIRNGKRGKVLCQLAMAWRNGRGTKGMAKRAMSEMCTLLDAYAAEDRKAGRPGADKYVESLLGGYNHRWCDK